MRSPFGGNGGMGGGGMLRTLQRAARGAAGGAAQEHFSHSTTTPTSPTSTATASSTSATTTEPNYNINTSNLLSLSSSFNNLPGSPTASLSSPKSFSDEFGWECVDGIEDESASSSGFCDDFVLGSVPSKDEVECAVSALQQVLDPTYFSQFIKGRLAYNSDNDVADATASSTGLGNRVFSVGKESDWIEPSLHLCNPRMVQRHGSDRVYDAFHLLHTEPSFQRMVTSLSSDRTVWDAVLNNDVVRELRESLIKADKSAPENLDDDSSDGSNAAMHILSWIFNNTKAKVMELIDKMTKLAHELFQPLEDEKTTGGGAANPFEDKLRSAFMLSIVVLLVVVVSRVRKA